MNTSDYYHVHYEDVYTILETEFTNGDNKNLYEINVQDMVDNIGTWFGKGFKTAESVLELFQKGWPEGKDRILDIFSVLDTVVLNDALTRAPRKRLNRFEFGDELDMQSVYMGDLDRAWSALETESVNTPKRYVVTYNLSHDAGTEASQMFWRPALACYVASRLQSEGYPVKVLAYANTRDAWSRLGGKPPYFVFSVTMKDWRDALSLDHLATTALGGFFRVIGFRAMLLEAWGLNVYMGYPASFPSEEIAREVLDVEGARNVQERWVHIPDDVYTKAAARTAALELLTSLNAEAYYELQAA